MTRGKQIGIRLGPGDNNPGEGKWNYHKNIATVTGRQQPAALLTANHSMSPGNISLSATNQTTTFNQILLCWAKSLLPVLVDNLSIQLIWTLYTMFSKKQQVQLKAVRCVVKVYKCYFHLNFIVQVHCLVFKFLISHQIALWRREARQGPSCCYPSHFAQLS